MTHLSDEELKAWYQHGKAEDRGRVIGHLAECETCRRSLSTYAAAAEPETSSTVVSITEAVPRGYAAKKPAPSVRAYGWLRPISGLVAAAVIVFAVIWITRPDPNVADDTVRGVELAGLSPDGTANGAEFRFASPFQASKYRLAVRDAAGLLVISADASDTPIRIDQASRDKLVAGQEYVWVITALDASGDTIAASAPKRFRYQP